MLFKGIAEIEVNGVKRGLKFGTLASGYFCEQEGVSLKGMAERMENPTPLTFIRCIYGAARAYNESKGMPVDFTPAHVSDWIDDIGIEKVSDIIFSAMQVYEDKAEKNGIAPETKPELKTGE